MRRVLPTGLIAVTTLAFAAGCGSHQQPTPTGALADVLNQRATTAADQHETGMNCLARAFGLEPPTAKRIDEVRTVYAWIYCHSQQGDTAEVMPAAVKLAGTPAVDIPRDDDYDADMKRLFPPDVRDAAINEPQPMQDLVAKLPSGPPRASPPR